jgi:hypothetical protein
MKKGSCKLEFKFAKNDIEWTSFVFFRHPSFVYSVIEFKIKTSLKIINNFIFNTTNME